MSTTGAPGWYADPGGSAGVRYWDGAAWSDGVAMPLDQPPAQRPKARVLPWVIGGVTLSLVLVALGVAAVIALSSNWTVRRVVNAATSGDNQFYKVAARSMAPALQLGDEIGATSRYGTLRRGDVVLFRRPGVPQRLLGRVVGLPGESVSSDSLGQFSVNDVALTEPYLAAGTMTFGVARTVISVGEYYVLGDRRENSFDSRAFGPIARPDVVAVADHIISPLDRAGHIPGSR